MVRNNRHKLPIRNNNRHIFLPTNPLLQSYSTQYLTGLCFPLQPTVSLSLSLHLIDLDNVNRILKVLSLLLFNTLCEFSVIYLFIKFIFGLCSISVWVMGKQWKRRRKVKFISGFFFFGCVFLFYIWVFPLIAVVIVK